MFAKTEYMSVGAFVRNEKEDVLTKFKRHMDKYGIVYKIVGTTIIIFVAGGGFDYALASNGIDVGARKLYYELISIGKWVIVFKGGMDTIKSVGNGDFDSAKKHFFSYLMIYLLLLGLPYGMDKVDEVFQNISKG
ncbi:hypothetical protein [Fredinandcohnia sp. 179-A 10B2 NHS]|uniref:hypothetical protein n=1 Tax=Fredinandcohnia sp. 179-A 10B2 NHS TaxID=3235176 RepID=UPI0039A09DC7